jgi:hypothetical protein
MAHNPLIMNAWKDERQQKNQGGLLVGNQEKPTGQMGKNAKASPPFKRERPGAVGKVIHT